MTPRTRRILFTAHQWSGLSFGIVLLLVAITGVLLTFQYELRQLTGPEGLTVSRPEAGPDLARITARLEAAYPDARLNFLAINPSVADYAVRASIVSEGGDYLQVYTDATGKYFLPDQAGDAFWGALRALHIQLLAGLPGLLLVLASAFVLIASSLVGVWLWTPRLKRGLQAFKVRLKAPARAVVLDLHNVLGVVLLVPMGLIALTGAAIVIAHLKPSAPALDDALWIGQERLAPAVAHVMNAVAERHPGAATLQFNYPAQDRPWYRVLIDDREQGYTTLYFGLEDLTLRREVIEADGSLWSRLEGNLGTALHEGYIAGLAGKLIVLLCGLSLSFAGVSGFWLWLQRRRSARSSRQHRAGVAAGRT